MAVPEHVAIIMDGNGRWATKRGLPRLAGHHKGASIVEGIVRHAADVGIKYLSLYAFSTENWKRLSDEVSGLMSLLERYIAEKLSALKANGVRLRFAGRKDRISLRLRAAMEAAEAETVDAGGLQLIVCIDYGGRQEIIDAVTALVADGVTDVTEESISKRMYLPDVPDPDLVIRTSGELRVSNFLLWESAYSEFYFTDTLWPDFDDAELDKAVESYSSRDRRKGGA
ncbi:MAG: di-trans,poly-cis-decaprenylcistransferase [Synergistaceae bacterium]|jgi:undecaprenyl diphosphate synthase|nr:di-trans,poly-cis-decaprenylcistransferase [Synergistaceae bacterium]